MICKRCGTVFCVDNETDAFYLSPDSVLYCSKVCKRKSQPSHQEHKKALNGNPRKIRRTISNLRQRDGDGCWLCLRPIDFTITDINDAMHHSRDHVIPRSLGGSLTLANMRLAHRKCNIEKGRELLAAG